MSILLPIDLSAPSQGAVKFAALLGPRLSKETLLLHVAPGRPELSLLSKLHALAEPLRDAGMRAHLRTRHGDPVDRICDEARIRQSELVLMGTRGSTHPLDGEPGSVARMVMDRCASPVVAVRWGDGPVGKHIMLIEPPRGLSLLARRMAQLLSEAVDAQPCVHPTGDRWRVCLKGHACAEGDRPIAVVDWRRGQVCPHWMVDLLRHCAGPVVIVSDQPDGHREGTRGGGCFRTRGV